MALRPISALSSAGLAATIAVGVLGCAASIAVELPDGVEVSVHQNRPDSEDRRLQVRVTNGTAAPLTITELAFSSPRFAEPAAYGKEPTTIRPGGIVDLPVTLPEPVCDKSAGDPRVDLGFELDGAAGRASVVPTDPLVQLDGISDRDCLGETIARIAVIHEPDAIRIETIGGRLVAMVDLGIVPTGSGGTLRIDAVDDTVLFALFDATRRVPREGLPLGIQVSGSDAPSTITIPLVPARCDAHAVAEDKRGTLLPLRVDVGELSGIHYLALSDALKGELYSYLGDACPAR